MIMPQPVSLREAKRRSNLLMFMMAFIFAPVLLWAQKNSCLDCHLEMEDDLKAPAESFTADIHQQFGLGCDDCHGGRPDEEDIELAKDQSFKGVPERAMIPELCGSCHADSGYMRRFNPNLRIDQLALYWTSRHGQLLKKGDAKAAVCTDCHGVHGIQAANFPKSMTFAWNIPGTCGRCHSDAGIMKAYGISTRQVEDYEQSVHARALFEKKDLSAPVCNDCHGNHGAAPPEVTSIAFVCRQCHSSAGDLFSKSPHKEAFDGLGISECEACHGNHKIAPPSDEMLAGGTDDVCRQCHDPGTDPHETGVRIKRQIDDYVASSDAVRELLDEAETKGVEVSEAVFKHQEAMTALVLARNLTHGLTPAGIDAELEKGLKTLADVRARGEEALREAKFRRTGLIIATIFIFLLAVALYLKIRDLKKPQVRS
jgi:predicted CXXCH cytochrome family protein